jgi:hypothetical protein
MRTLALLTLAALAGCSTTPREAEQAAEAAAATEDRLAVALAGLTPGPPQACLEPFATRRNASVKGYGSTLVYTISRNLKYVTVAPGCEGVGRREDILITSTPIGRNCSGDIVQTVDRTSRFPTGSCAFGQFVPYRRP